MTDSRTIDKVSDPAPSTFPDMSECHDRPLGLCIRDPKTGDILIQGEHLGDVFSYEELAVYDKMGLFAGIVDEDLDHVARKWNEAHEALKPFAVEFRIDSEKSGQIWVRMSGVPADGELICVLEDISTTVQKRNDLMHAKAKVDKSLQTKNFLLGRLSHEIRTPMNAVIGIADALMYYKVDPAIMPKLELIQSSADNILRILDRSLNHAKLDAEKMSIDAKPGNPRELVERCCQLWVHQAEKSGTKIECVIDDQVPSSIVFDKYRYEQCLNNLISNAVKFTQNGLIKVVLTVFHKGDEKQLVLAVKDSGIGMTKEQQSRIFNPFEQADESISQRFGGTGLGMNITKQLIELMGGTINVKSALGKGTIFALSLPLALTTSRPTPSPAGLSLSENDSLSHDSGPFSRLKILVADDNPTNHVVIKSLLTDQVAEIYTANNGQEVLDILEVRAIDIVLMDIHMPVMDGIEATLAIRGANKPWSNVVIIALTADPQYQQKRLCVNIGMDDALGKPVKMKEILESFEAVLNVPQDIEFLEEAV